jgi:hypothetical protein
MMLEDAPIKTKSVFNIKRAVAFKTTTIKRRSYDSSETITGIPI